MQVPSATTLSLIYSWQTLESRIPGTGGDIVVHIRLSVLSSRWWFASVTSSSMYLWRRVEEPTNKPAFDYTKARAALQKLQQAPESRVAAGGRRVPRVPSPTPVARGDLRKRTVSPARTMPASTRPVTPPGFAAPPAPKRPHLAFGSRAAPPQAAPVQGQSLPHPGVHIFSVEMQLSVLDCCMRRPNLLWGMGKCCRYAQKETSCVLYETWSACISAWARQAAVHV